MIHYVIYIRYDACVPERLHRLSLRSVFIITRAQAIGLDYVCVVLCFGQNAQ